MKLQHEVTFGCTLPYITHCSCLFPHEHYVTMKYLLASHQNDNKSVQLNVFIYESLKLSFLLESSLYV